MPKLPPPPDFDENPEWSEEDIERARPADEVAPPHVVSALVRKRKPKRGREMDLSEVEAALAKVSPSAMIGFHGLNAAYAIGGVVIGILIREGLTTADEVADALAKRTDIPGMDVFARSCRIHMPGGSGFEVIDGGRD